MRTMRLACAGAALIFCLMGAVVAHAQWAEPPQTGSQPELLPDRTIMAGQSGIAPTISAELVDKHQNEKAHKAVVKVETDSISMMDPAAAHYAPKLDQAHLQYQLDGGDIFNSTSKVWTFTHLPAGKHRVLVSLVGNDNRPHGLPITLKLDVPK